MICVDVFCEQIREVNVKKQGGWGRKNGKMRNDPAEYEQNWGSFSVDVKECGKLL